MFIQATRDRAENPRPLLREVADVVQSNFLVCASIQHARLRMQFVRVLLIGEAGESTVVRIFGWRYIFGIPSNCETLRLGAIAVAHLSIGDRTLCLLIEGGGFEKPFLRRGVYIRFH